MNIRGYLGIDAGARGLSVIVTDERLKIIADGEASYAMVPGRAAAWVGRPPAGRDARRSVIFVSRRRRASRLRRRSRRRDDNAHDAVIMHRVAAL